MNSPERVQKYITSRESHGEYNYQNWAQTHSDLSANTRKLQKCSHQKDESTINPRAFVFRYLRTKQIVSFW